MDSLGAHTSIFGFSTQISLQAANLIFGAARSDIIF
jgi:hypothetical protein